MAGEKRKDEQRKKEKNARKRRGHQREQGGANEWTTGHDHGRECTVGWKISPRSVQFSLRVLTTTCSNAACPRLWVQNEENNSPRRESTEDGNLYNKRMVTLFASYVHWEDAADCERVSCRWFNYEDPVSEQLADILIGDSINRAVPLPIENMTMTDHFTETSRTLRSQQLNPVALPLLSGNGGTGMRIRTLITRTLAAIAPVVTAVEAAAASGRQGG
ncbi:hypothetical protein PV325_012420 [Microctonus aethiopoides]|nr:hypothetical protein PV325_012420 [Microctonus aethiopoides]